MACLEVSQNLKIKFINKITKIEKESTNKIILAGRLDADRHAESRACERKWPCALISLYIDGVFVNFCFCCIAFSRLNQSSAIMLEIYFYITRSSIGSEFTDVLENV